MNIVTITVNPALDKNTKITHLAPEIKLKCDKPTYEAGGGGINVSRVIQRMGGSSLAIFQSGGSNGQLIEKLLRKENINCYPIHTERWTRENLIVTEQNNEHQYRFGMPGPQLSEPEWMEFIEVLNTLDPKPDIIVASGSIPPGVPHDFFVQIAKVANRLNAKLVLDTSGQALAETIKHEKVFLLKPNVKELCDITGHEDLATCDPESMALQLVQEGRAEMVVISLGPNGAFMATKEGLIKVTPPTIKVKSPVGAGDSMVAGLILAYARGASPTEILNYGVACGTATAMTDGTELCRKEDVDTLYGSMKG